MSSLLHKLSAQNLNLKVEEGNYLFFLCMRFIRVAEYFTLWAKGTSVWLYFTASSCHDMIQKQTLTPKSHTQHRNQGLETKISQDIILKLKELTAWDLIINHEPTELRTLQENCQAYLHPTSQQLWGGVN